MRGAIVCVVFVVGACKSDSATAPASASGQGPSTDPCVQILFAVASCAQDAQFQAGLTRDLDQRAAHEQLRLLDVTFSHARETQPRSTYPNEATDDCEQGRASSEADSPGFLAHDLKPLAAPDVLADCGRLGDAIREAGGLFSFGTIVD